MKSLVLLGVLVAALISSAAHAAVKALVDTDHVATGDTLELILAHDGQASSQPDLAPLEQDFDVISTSRSSNVRIINGSYSSETQLHLTLAPKRSGQLTIPSLTWDNDKSAPIRVTVGGGSAAQPADVPPQSATVFLKTTVDQPQPYVQGAVNLTVRLYAGVPVYRASLDLPASSDVLVQQVGKDANSETEIDGRRYNVVERHYLLFPQHSGAIKVPGPMLDAQVAARSRNDPFANDPFADFFGRSPLAGMMQTTKPIRVHADDIVLNVRSRPAAATARYWIPARKFDVSSEWHPDTLEVRAGDPVTLDVQLSAAGLTAAQLPDIASLLELPAGLKAYPDQPKLDNAEQQGTLVGHRDQSIALIADQPGNFTLPAIHIQWWDTQVDQLREALLPARSLKVLPAVSGAPSAVVPRNAVVPIPNSAAPSTNPTSTPPRSQAPSSESLWPWVSLTLAVLWIATLLTWWWSQRRAPRVSNALRPRSAPKPSGSQARERFLTACKVDDAMTARRALIEWAQLRWPEAPPAGLRALANRLGDANLDALLIELDRACFAGGEWHGSALASALGSLTAAPEKKRAARGELAELYP